MHFTSRRRCRNVRRMAASLTFNASPTLILPSALTTNKRTCIKQQSTNDSLNKQTYLQTRIRQDGRHDAPLKFKPRDIVSNLSNSNISTLSIWRAIDYDLTPLGAAGARSYPGTLEPLSLTSLSRYRSSRTERGGARKESPGAGAAGGGGGRCAGGVRSARRDSRESGATVAVDSVTLMLVLVRSRVRSGRNE